MEGDGERRVRCVGGEFAAEDLRISATVVRVLSRQLEKLGIRFRVTRKALKEPITEVIDYKTQQARLFPLLASVYAFRFVGEWLKWLYTDVMKRLQANDFSTLHEAHACTAGLKSYTASATSAVEESRDGDSFYWLSMLTFVGFLAVYMTLLYDLDFRPYWLFYHMFLPRGFCLHDAVTCSGPLSIWVVRL